MIDFLKRFWSELNQKENFKYLVIFVCVVMVVATYLLVKVATAITEAININYQQWKLEDCLKHTAPRHRGECFRKYSAKAFSSYDTRRPTPYRIKKSSSGLFDEIYKEYGGGEDD